MSYHSYWSFFCESLKLIWSTEVLSEVNFLGASHVFKNSAILVICFPAFPRELVTCASFFSSVDGGGKFALFALHVVSPYWFIVWWEIGLAFYVIGFENIRIHPSTHYRIRCGFIFFRIRCRIRRMRVDGNRIRKKKFADSKICGYMCVWTGP